MLYCDPRNSMKHAFHRLRSGGGEATSQFGSRPRAPSSSCAKRECLTCMTSSYLGLYRPAVLAGNVGTR